MTRQPAFDPEVVAGPMRRVHFFLYLYGTLLSLILIPALLYWQPFDAARMTIDEARGWVRLNRILMVTHAVFLLWVLVDLPAAWRQKYRGRTRTVVEAVIALLVLALLNAMTVLPAVISSGMLSNAAN